MAANDPHLEALAEAIMKQLSGPAPTAPTPPAFTGLSPLAAAAGAMNPQQIPTLIQKQMGPAQAQFAQQQAAFEQAMQGRRDALTAGTSILNTGVRSDASVDAARYRSGPMAAKGQIRVVEGPDGKPALQEFVPDGQGGFTPGKILATGPDTMRFLASPEGYLPVSPRTGQAAGGFVQQPGGGNLVPPPPAGTVSDVAAGTATLQGLDALRTAYKSIREKTASQSLPSKVGRSLVGSSRFGGALQGTRDYAEYASARRASLNAYVKSVTGAAFTIGELERYEAMFPEPWDDEALAEQKIQNLSQRAVADMEAKIRAFPAAGAAGPASSVDRILERYRKERDGANSTP